MQLYRCIQEADFFNSGKQINVEEISSFTYEDALALFEDANVNNYALAA